MPHTSTDDYMAVEVVEAKAEGGRELEEGGRIKVGYTLQATLSA